MSKGERNDERKQMVDISICIVNWNRSRVIVKDKTLELLPNCVSCLNTSFAGFKTELVIADFGSTDWPVRDWIPSKWKQSYKVVDCQLPFSLGKGRNTAVKYAVGKTMFLIDADMIVPANFASICMEQIEKGYALFPLYRRQKTFGSDVYYAGAGWGNVAISSEVLRQVQYPETLLWGGEDTAVSNAIKKIAPIWRQEIPGFIHQWHPKNSDWYQKGKK